MPGLSVIFSGSFGVVSLNPMTVSGENGLFALLFTFCVFSVVACVAFAPGQVFFFPSPGSRFCELPLFILFCLIIGSVCGERVGRFVELSCPRRGCAGPHFCLPLASSPRCGCKLQPISACLVVVHRRPLPLFPVSLSRE